MNRVNVFAIHGCINEGYGLIRIFREKIRISPTKLWRVCTQLSAKAAVTFPSSITYAARVLFIWTATARGIQSAVSVIYSVLYVLNLEKVRTFTFHCFVHRRRPTGRGVRGSVALNSGSLSTSIQAESRHYSGKTQYMFDYHLVVC